MYTFSCETIFRHPKVKITLITVVLPAKANQAYPWMTTGVGCETRNSFAVAHFLHFTLEKEREAKSTNWMFLDPRPCLLHAPPPTPTFSTPFSTHFQQSRLSLHSVSRISLLHFVFVLSLVFPPTLTWLSPASFACRPALWFSSSVLHLK